MPKAINTNPINITQGHCWAPTTPQQGSQDVFIENFGAVRVGDPYIPHTPGCTPIPTTHPVIPIMGSPNVFVNNLPLMRDGDPMNCGDVADNGARTVFVNGGGDGGTGDPDETTGYTIDPPQIIYSSTQLRIGYAVTRLFGEEEVFLRGCPVDFRIQDIFTPLNEETTGQIFRNYPGPPLTIRSGAELPRYAQEDRRRPIPISLVMDSQGPLPEGIIFDSVTGSFTGRIPTSFQLGREGMKIFVTGNNFVGSTTIELTVTFQKFLEFCQ